MQDLLPNHHLHKDNLNIKKMSQKKSMPYARISHSFQGIQGSSKTTPIKNPQLDMSQKYGFSHLQIERASQGQKEFLKNDTTLQEEDKLKEITNQQFSINSIVDCKMFHPKIPSKKFDPRFQLLRLIRQRNVRSSLGLFSDVPTKQTLKSSTNDSVVICDENNPNASYKSNIPLTSKFILQINRPSSVQHSRKNSQQNLHLHRLSVSSAVSIPTTSKASTNCFLEQKQHNFNSVLQETSAKSKDLLKEQSVESTQRDYQNILLMNSTPQSLSIRPQTVASAAISLTQYSSLETQPDYSFFDLLNYENRNPQKQKKTAISYCKSKQASMNQQIKAIKPLDSPRISLDNTFTEAHLEEIPQKDYDNNILITSLEQDRETYEEKASSIQSEEHLFSRRYEDYLSSRYDLSDQDPCVSIRRHEKQKKKEEKLNFKENTYFKNGERYSLKKHNIKDEQLKKWMPSSSQSQHQENEDYQPLILGNNKKNNNNNQIHSNSHKTAPDWFSYQQSRINLCKQAINNRLCSEMQPNVIFQNRQIKCKTTESMNCQDAKFEIAKKQLTCTDFENPELTKTCRQQYYLPKRPRLTRKSESDIEKLRMNIVQQPLVNNKFLKERRKTESNMDIDYLDQELSLHPRIHSRKVRRAQNNIQNNLIY